MDSHHLASGGMDAAGASGFGFPDPDELIASSSNQTLEEYIRRIEDHRLECERQGNYQEAELVKHILERLRKENEMRQIEMLKNKQAAERMGVDEAHMIEFTQFNDLWMSKREIYEQHAAELEQAMLERHSLEMKEFRDELAQDPPRVRYSKELLNLRKIEETLARQKEYVEAHKTKLKADQMEAFELERLRGQQAEAIAKKESKLFLRHKQELGALLKRIESGRLEFEKQRQKDFERLVQRYQNVKKGLEQQQNIERARAGNYLAKHANNKKAPIVINPVSAMSALSQGMLNVNLDGIQSQSASDSAPLSAKGPRSSRESMIPLVPQPSSSYGSSASPDSLPSVPSILSARRSADLLQPSSGHSSPPNSARSPSSGAGSAPNSARRSISASSTFPNPVRAAAAAYSQPQRLPGPPKPQSAAVTRK